MSNETKQVTDNSWWQRWVWWVARKLAGPCRVYVVTEVPPPQDDDAFKFNKDLVFSSWAAAQDYATPRRMLVIEHWVDWLPPGSIAKPAWTVWFSPEGEVIGAMRGAALNRVISGQSAVPVGVRAMTVADAEREAREKRERMMRTRDWATLCDLWCK